MTDKLLYTPREAAELLGISRSTFYLLLGRGDVDSVHIGASRRVAATALHAYVRKITRAAGDGLPEANDRRSDDPRPQHCRGRGCRVPTSTDASSPSHQPSDVRSLESEGT